MASNLYIDFVERNRLFCALDELLNHKLGVVQIMQRVADLSNDIVFTAYTTGKVKDNKAINLFNYGYTFDMFGYASVFVYAQIVDKDQKDFDHKAIVSKYNQDHGFTFPYAEDYKLIHHVFEHSNYNVLYIVCHHNKDIGEESIVEQYNIVLK